MRRPDESETPPVTIPIEDTGVVVLDNSRITITTLLLEALMANNVAVITCGSNHLPVGLHLPLDGNTLQTERFTRQIAASLPLKKQLWQQTVQAKITNQAAALRRLRKVETGNMEVWAKTVRSGDPDNLEARAAIYYWRNLFPEIPGFLRRPDGESPNHLLNYGYAIVRALTARALVAAGLLPTLGLHHCNRYNAYCLADDIMEPYRPYVDELVVNIVRDSDNPADLRLNDKTIKRQLLSLPLTDTVIEGKVRPMINAIAGTASSLQACFEGKRRRLSYPVISY
ncbi:MAG: type II CRISPR-associated endonuclease Cas1 [Staphylococcus sp.]|nr:type II CRISPR-associated endonuclease Cas1 [Staphylococcus sp.]